MTLTYRQPFRGDYPITQKYGEIIPGVTYKNEPHTGIDYACPEGTPILASADGTVKFAALDQFGYGLMVILYHSDGKGTCYAHLSRIDVKLRDTVKQGDQIGLSGHSGNATGPHLHFEARSKWFDYKAHEDPVIFLPLMNFADAPEYTEQPIIKNAEDFMPGTMKIVAPAGAKAFDLKFGSFNTLRAGTEVSYTGDSVKRTGYEYLRCFATFYIAVNDHETQILDKVK